MNQRDRSSFEKQNIVFIDEIKHMEGQNGVQKGFGICEKKKNMQEPIVRPVLGKPFAFIGPKLGYPSTWLAQDLLHKSTF